MSNVRDLGADYLNSIAALGAKVGVEVLGLPEETAMILGEELAVRVSEEHGGEQLYISKGRIFHAQKAEKAIMREFLATKRDYSSTAKACKCSTRHIYRVVKRFEDAERVRRQGTLLLEN